ncbi:MAG: hypothetical protein K1X72_16650 [Pyrinomonadaceae bacterium]|nr:hypothetical protein [Pyrinomonadaceae bacterium]
MRKETNLFVELVNFGDMRILRNFALAIIIFPLLVVGADAQKKGKKPRKSSSPPSVMSMMIQSLEMGCVPTQRDSKQTVQISKASNGTLTFKTDESSSDSLEMILSSIKGKPEVTIKPDPSMDFGSVAKVLYAVRRITNDCVNIEASTNSINPYVYYLPEPRENNSADIKPNPLTLIVFISQNGKITLNTESMGSVENTTLLTKRLKEVFKYRIDNGVLRERTNEVETSLVVKPSSSIKFGDLIKVINAIKETEASPIGLIIDDLQP